MNEDYIMLAESVAQLWTGYNNPRNFVSLDNTYGDLIDRIEPPVTDVSSYDRPRISFFHYDGSMKPEGVISGSFQRFSVYEVYLDDIDANDIRVEHSVDDRLYKVKFDAKNIKKYFYFRIHDGVSSVIPWGPSEKVSVHKKGFVSNGEIKGWPNEETSDGVHCVHIARSLRKIVLSAKNSTFLPFVEKKSFETA